MKKVNQKGHQGDVQFRTVTVLPSGAVAIAHRPIALGELSGHEHILTGDVELFEFEGTIYAAIGSDGAMLQHVHESQFQGMNKAWNTKEVLPVADHKPIAFQPNQVVEVWIQNAFNPYTELMEQVID